MKKTLICSLALLLILAAGSSVMAHKYVPSRQRDDARNVIKRTAVVLEAARRVVVKGGSPFGLSRAIAHQNYARRQYERGFYREAIEHSLRARNLAENVLERNHARRRPHVDWDDNERRYRRNSPSDDQLDLKVRGMIDDDHQNWKVQIEMDI